MTAKETTVYVGMSGGVDSSVSAALLKEQGYTVVGVFIRVWHPEWLPCDWKKEREDAMRVCAVLDIPFRTLDLSEAYKKEVVDYMLREYASGRTPNPDVMCNKHIKFGSFLEYAQKEGASYVATGHYARIDNHNGEYKLLAGVDSKKDQSYFLWTLTQEVLSQIFFPVGELQKTDVRTLAKKYGLPVAEKKDSQGVCFLGKIHMREFLKHYIKTQSGAVLDESGNTIGTHEGALLYTIGQRHGFKIDAHTPHTEAHYVVDKDIENNTVTVSTRKETDSAKKDKQVELRDVHWIGTIPETRKSYTARIRYRQKLQPCQVLTYTPATKQAVIEFADLPQDVARGQSVVVYDGEVCLGGGVTHTTF